ECQSLERLLRGFCHSVYLVAAVALHVLPESVLRSVGPKFLSLLRGLHCHCAVGDLSDPAGRTTHRHRGGQALFAAMCAECRPSSHTGDGAILYWAWRLYDFHSGFSHFHSPFGAGIFPRGTRRYPAMAIPDWHLARIDWRIRRYLVS